MGLAPSDIDQMYDIHTAADQGIGHERSVTPPPQRLRAHHREAFAGFRPRNECLDGVAKCRRIHVVRVPAEPGVPECHMPGLCTPGSPAAKLLALPFVRDATGGQAGSERVTPELRMTPGAREPPDVDQDRDTRPLQDREQLLGGSGAVPDGQHNRHRFARAL
jgi:hypothetical protein